MIQYYKLDGHKNVVPCTLDELQDFFSPDKVVKQQDVGNKLVSTVFLMMDCRYPSHEGEYENYKPLVFETMIKDIPTGEWENYQARYCTYQEALAGHNAIVELLKQGLSLDGDN